MSKFKKNHRPFSVTLFTLGVLSFAILHFSRFAFSLDQWQFLSRLPVSTFQYYFPISGIFWGSLGLTTFYQLWFRKKRANIFAVRVLFFYMLSFWIEQIYIMKNPFRNTNWVFMVVSSMIILTTALWVFSRPAIKNYFGDTNE